MQRLMTCLVGSMSTAPSLMWVSRLAIPGKRRTVQILSEPARPYSRLGYFDRLSIRVESQIASGCCSLPFHGCCCVGHFSLERCRRCGRCKRCLGRSRSDGSGYCGSGEGRLLRGGDRRRVNGGSELKGYEGAFLLTAGGDRRRDNVSGLGCGGGHSYGEGIGPSLYAGCRLGGRVRHVESRTGSGACLHVTGVCGSFGGHESRCYH